MMMIHDIIRERLLVAAGVIKPDVPKHPLLSELKLTEWSSEFEQKMRNRLIMGSFRYQRFKDKRKSFEYDCATEAIDRIKRYLKDGNTEHLVDAANMCLLEFEFGDHPQKHFVSIDDGRHTVKRMV